MSLVDLQKKTILTQGRLKMIYEKKILQKCLNTGGILSDTGKVWLTSVQQPTAFLDLLLFLTCNQIVLCV